MKYDTLYQYSPFKKQHDEILNIWQLL